MKEFAEIFQIKDGKFIYPKDSQFNTAVKLLSDGKYERKIKKVYRTRSLNQNAFYWGVFLKTENEILKNEGWNFPTLEALHEWNKENFNRKELINETTGEIKHYTSSTTDLNTLEFEIMLENIRMEFLDSYKCNLPYPN